MLAIANTGKIGRGFGKNAGEWTGRVEISKEENPGSKRSMHGYILTYSASEEKEQQTHTHTHTRSEFTLQHMLIAC